MTGLVPNEIHIGPLPRLPIAVLERPHGDGHQSLHRDQVDYCDLATDYQQRSYALVHKHHAPSISRITRRNSIISSALHQTPSFAVGKWAWVYNSVATIHQRAQKDTDHAVLKAKMSFDWTESYRILAVGPSSAEDTPHRKPVADKFLHLDLPLGMPESDPKRRVSVVRCKPGFNPRDISVIPPYSPAGLNNYVLNNYTTKSLPYHEPRMMSPSLLRVCVSLV